MSDPNPGKANDEGTSHSKPPAVMTVVNYHDRTEYRVEGPSSLILGVSAMQILAQTVRLGIQIRFGCLACVVSKDKKAPLLGLLTRLFDVYHMHEENEENDWKSQTNDSEETQWIDVDSLPRQQFILLQIIQTAAVSPTKIVKFIEALTPSGANPYDVLKPIAWISVTLILSAVSSMVKNPLSFPMSMSRLLPEMWLRDIETRSRMIRHDWLPLLSKFISYIPDRMQQEVKDQLFVCGIIEHSEYLASGF